MLCIGDIIQHEYVDLPQSGKDVSVVIFSPTPSYSYAILSCTKGVHSRGLFIGDIECLALIESTNIKK